MSKFWKILENLLLANSECCISKWNYLCCILVPLQRVNGLDLINQNMVFTHGALSGNQPFPPSIRIDTCLEAASPRCESVSQHLRYCPVSGKSLSQKKTDAKDSFIFQKILVNLRLCSLPIL